MGRGGSTPHERPKGLRVKVRNLYMNQQLLLNFHELFQLNAVQGRIEARNKMYYISTSLSTVNSDKAMRQMKRSWIDFLNSTLLSAISTG